MAANLLYGLSKKLIRVIVDPNDAQFNLDSAIGRAAHICFLENPIAAACIASLLLPLVS